MDEYILEGPHYPEVAAAEKQLTKLGHATLHTTCILLTLFASEKHALPIMTTGALCHSGTCVTYHSGTALHPVHCPEHLQQPSDWVTTSVLSHG